MHSNNRIETDILAVFLAHRRCVEGEPCALQLCDACLAPHRAKVRAAVEHGEPVHFVLPAFPAKSPNPRKVLGQLPDMAERLALRFLRDCCRQVRAIYAPGARITLCSDGRVFGDLVGVSDDNVTAYAQSLLSLIADLGAEDLDTFSLEEAFGLPDFDALRARLVERYARPLDALRQRVLEEPAMHGLFNGIARFLYEDLLALDGGERSHTALRRQAHDLAYPVIQRSAAWSALVVERFPGAVRLSIHPQPCPSDKLGIHLLATGDTWLTPWHGVAVDVGDRFVLLKRYQAEDLQARLIWREGRPSHFATFRPLRPEEYRPCHLSAANHRPLPVLA